MSTDVVDRAAVIRHLKQLYRTLAHGLTQPNISPNRFNSIREQLIPLRLQLEELGEDVEPVAQARHVMLTRVQRRERARSSKHSTYEARVMHKLRERAE